MKNKIKSFTYDWNKEFKYEVSYFDCLKAYMDDYMRCFGMEEDEHNEKVEQVMELLKDVNCVSFVDHNEQEIKDLFEGEALEFFEDNFFVCKECGKLCELCDRCEHDDDVCKECCEECRSEDAYWDNYNREVEYYMEDRY